MLTVLMSVVWINGYGDWCITCLPASSLMPSYPVETRKLTISFLRLHCILHSVSNYHPQLPCHCRRLERCEWSRAILLLLLLLLPRSIVAEAFVFFCRGIIGGPSVKPLVMSLSRTLICCRVV